MVETKCNVRMVASEVGQLNGNMKPQSSRSRCISNFFSQEIRAQVDGSQAYEAERVTQGCTDSNGNPLPLDDECLGRIRSLRSKYNILHVPPSPTDLDGDTPAGFDAQDNTMWARTSLDAFLEFIAGIRIELVAAVRYKYTANIPSHLVAFGP